MSGAKISSHDPNCRRRDSYTYGKACDCALIAKVRAQALREAADVWQQGEWTTLTARVKAGSVIGAAQTVTDWLRDRADRVDGSSD
jgi:hypothetical protein